VYHGGAYSRSRARIERMCGAGADARTLRLQVIDELRRVIGFDAYAWLLTDPETSVGVSPLASVPWLSELPRQIQLKYATRVNRWTTLGDTPVALLHQSTGGDLSQSVVWAELLVRYAVTDAASVVFADRFGCWAFLELWRSGTAAGFSRVEAAFLVDLVAPLTLALRRSQASTFTTGRKQELPHVGPVVLLLSAELVVRGQTAETMGYLRVLVPPEEGQQPIPAAAYNVAAQLLAVEAVVDSNLPSARVHLSDSRWMTVRAARIEGPGPTPRRDIAVTIEETSAAQRVDLFARAFGLSARERVLLEHLATGSDTRELARQMLLSENTVQDHLKSVFAKTGANSRRALLSRALGG
jgi:DNA-binding CsgD family transcriptional regulator